MREAFKLWQDWRAGKTIHKPAVAFAHAVIDERPIIESPQTFRRWGTA